MDPEGAVEVSPPPHGLGVLHPSPHIEHLPLQRISQVPAWRLDPGSSQPRCWDGDPFHRHLRVPPVAVPWLALLTPPPGAGSPWQRWRRKGVTPKPRLLGWGALGQVLGEVPGHPQTLPEPAPMGCPRAGGSEPGAMAVLVLVTPSPSPMPGGGPREGSDQAGGPE